MKNPIFLCLLLVLFSLVLPTSSFAQEGADGFRVYLPLVNEIKGSSGGTNSCVSESTSIRCPRKEV